jgi:NADP-dependent 3-hydroxy acid dehydrogenase YdfG
MTDRIAIITGAGAGIGRGTALHFAAQGWRIGALDRDKEALAELAGMIPADRCLALACDVGVEDEVGSAFSRIGGWADGVDLLVNNAGLANPYCGPLEDLALSDWQAWIDAS